ncbi:MAG: hypothetical protein AAGD14_19385, partial [Planctomycetota bacterium]
MAEGKITVCPQCGKKYKLKAGFAAASFACTACGATVWVDGKPKGPSSTRKRSAGARGAPKSGRAGAKSGGRGRQPAPSG